MKRYETVRFNWYRQCRVPCYAILENSLKMFKSSCLTAQEDNLQKRQFFGLSRQVETRIPPYFTRPKSEKIWPLFCRNLQLDPPCGRRHRITCVCVCGGGGGGSNPIDPFTSTPSGLRWYKKMVDWFNKKWLYSRSRFFFEATITELKQIIGAHTLTSFADVKDLLLLLRQIRWLISQVNDVTLLA